MAVVAPGRGLNEDYGPDSGGRQKNVTIVKPILVGCRSKKLTAPIPNPHAGQSSQASPNDHSHAWTLYVRPYKNGDISVWIKKVQFKLHDTYPNSTRSCTTKPFEVHETGWGEFEVQVKIFFVDPNERQVTLWTYVRLFKKENDFAFFYIGDELVAEHYDELVFVEPTLMMIKYLNTQDTYEPGYKADRDYDKEREKTIMKIQKARDRVTPEIQALSSQFEQYKNSYAAILAILRGEQPKESQQGSEYDESLATSSQGSLEP